MATNFPRKLPKVPTNNVYPSDLFSGGRNYYAQIGLSEYKFNWTNIQGDALKASNFIKLPMPRKVNDNQVIQWEEWSGAESAASVVGSGLGTIGSVISNVGAATALATGGAGLGAVRLGQTLSSIGSVAGGSVGGIQMLGTFTGQTINPFMFMMFKRPSFKEHTLQWVFTPNNEQESDELKKIINTLKKASLPELGSITNVLSLGFTDNTGIGGYKYPKIATVQLIARDEENKYLFKFKPCAIVGVQVDYSAAGMPSTFKNGAPTMVSLAIQLKEIQLWSSNDYDDPFYN